MMSTRDEQAGSVNVYALFAGKGSKESDGYVPRLEQYQETYGRPRKTIRAAVFGGLAGGVFLLGMAAAIISDHFWPIFLATLAIAWLIGSLTRSNAQAMYVGFQGFVFFLGLA